MSTVQLHENAGSLVWTLGELPPKLRTVYVCVTHRKMIDTYLWVYSYESSLQKESQETNEVDCL